MKSKFTTLIIFIIFAAGVSANHLNGGHISYRFLGNNKFEISLNVYRDCQGSGSASAPITVSCSAGSINFSLPFVSVTDITDVANIGSNCGSYCVAKGTYGYAEYLFKGVIDLTALACCEIDIRCEQLGRVPISTASTSQLYLDAKVNKCLGSSMSWAKFPPQLLLFLGQDQLLNFSASDTTDYDSISYELVSSYAAVGTPASYTGAFSAAKPLTFLGFPNPGLNAPAGLQFDSQKGNLRFRPTVLNQTAVIAVEMTEWRKVSNVWTKVGSSRREQVVTVITASQSSNTFQNSQDDFAVCTGDTSAIIIDISDGNISDTFELNLVHQVKWASVSFLTGINSKKVLVRLLADSITDNLKANAFTLETRDYGCPVRGRSVKTYGIKEGSPFIDSSLFSKSALCGRVKFKVQQRMAGTHFSYTWVLKGENLFLERTADSIEVFASDTGWVKADIWVVSKQHCNYYKYADSIYVGPENFPKPFAGNDTAVCRHDSIVLKGTVTGGGTPPFTYEWLGKGAGQQLKVALLTGANFFSVRVTDSNKCVAADGIRIINPRPVVTAVQKGSIICQPKKADFIVTDTIPGGQVISNIFTDSSYSINTDTYIAVRESYLFTDTLGCPATDTSLVLISALDVSLPPNLQACAGDTFTIQPVVKRANRPLVYAWTDGSSDSILRKPAPTVIGNYLYTLTLKDKHGCSIPTVPVMVKVVQLPNVSAPSLPPTCSSYNAVNLSSYGTPAGGVWSGQDVSGNNFNASAAGSGTHALRYTYTDSIGCDASASTSVLVTDPPVVDFTASATIVLPGTSINFTNQSTGSPFLSEWTFTGPVSPTTVSTHNASFLFIQQGEYDVKLKVNDGICPPDSLVKTSYIKVGSNYLSVKETLSEELKVYPNPAADKVYIETAKPIHEIIVTDIAGKRVAAGIAVQGQAAIISRTDEAAGVYVLKIITEDDSYSIKFVWE